jgi:hypothetical protein
MNKHATIITVLALAAISTAMATLTGCQQQEAPKAVVAPPTAPTAPPPPAFNLVGGIQDIMSLEVDPSADAIWDAVGTDVSKAGTKENHPQTAKQWEELRNRALVLIEATNLLVMNGRHVAREGVQKLDDQGTPGNLSAEQSQQVIDANRSTFDGFATAMGVVGQQMLKAIDARNPQALMDAGAALDEVCESCHLKFWYPGQRIPPFPDEAPEGLSLNDAQPGKPPAAVGTKH